MNIPIYPDITDEDFSTKLLNKMEFKKLYTDPKIFELQKDETSDDRINRLCNNKIFTLQTYQEFIRNFMSPYTQYNSILGFWGVGVGKTCMAIQTAEGLKPMVEKYQKKIYIIAKKQLQENFIKELYNFQKEIIEEKTNLIPGSLQCTNDTYYISHQEEETLVTRRKKILKKIKEVYKFFAIQKFCNYVDIELSASNNGYNNDIITNMFSNSVIIIDEAHTLTGENKKRMGHNLNENLDELDLDDEIEPDIGENDDADADAETAETAETGDVDENKSITSSNDKLQSIMSKRSKKISKNGILTVLKGILKNAKHIKLLLLTATPMKDMGDELVDLINLLRINDDKSEIKAGDILSNMNTHDQSQISVDEVALKKYTKGYISYVRGENIVTFPEVRDVNAEHHIYKDIAVYKPKPIYDETGILLPTDFRNKYIEFNDLLRCPMRLYQYSVYRSLLNRQIAKNKTADMHSINIDSLGRIAACFIFPEKPGVDNDISKLYGNIGFNEVFDMHKSGADKGKKYVQYIIKPPYNGDFLLRENLEKYSSKYFTFLNHLIYSKGIVFVYNDFVSIGVCILALILEMNGYLKYSKEGNKNAQNYLNYAGKPKRMKCALCEFYSDDAQHTGVGGTKQCNFKQAYYVLFKGNDVDNNFTHEIDVINNKENLYGGSIKVILGTSVSAEGIDYKAIREIHIMGPWHNNTRLQQVIGRGIRNCGHKDLKEDERNVTIFRYSSSSYIPDTLYHSYYADNMKCLESVQKLVDKKMTLMAYIKDNNSGNNKLLADDILMTSYANNVTLKEIFYETSDEKVYNRIEKKDIIIKKLERVLKKVAVDCALMKDLNLYGLKNKDNSRECDFMKCDYECDTSIENIKDLTPENTDMGTYNEFFYEPNIRYIKQVVYELCRTTTVLNQKDLITIIMNKDNRITKNVILEALDRIVGDGKINKPYQLVDMYNRFSTLIKTQEKGVVYYVLHPNDLKDKQAPIYYKTTPLSIKQQFISFTLDDVKKVNIAKVNIDEEIEKLYNIKEVSIFQAKLDRYNKIDIEHIFEKAVIGMHAKSASCEYVYRVILEYLYYYGIIIEQGDIIYHNILNKWKYFSTETNVWQFAQQNNIQKLKFTTDIAAFSYANIYGLIEYNQITNETSFKILDNTSHVAHYNNPKLSHNTISNIESKRDKLRGINCKSCGMYDLEVYYSKFNKYIKTKEGEDILSYNIKNGRQKNDVCNTLEFYLRYIDAQTLEQNLTGQPLFIKNNIWVP
jgi:hypothetical protein